MTTPFQQDLIREIFGERPELAFLGTLAQQGLPPSAQEFFRRRTSDFLMRFNQAVGQQLAMGGLPTLTPEEFFGGLDFQEELFRFSPLERGLGIRRFAPPVRFLFS